MPRSDLPKPESEFLSPEDIRYMTGRARFGQQCERLTELGVPFRLVGRQVLVSRFHVREWLAGKTVRPPVAPNWAAVR